MRARFYSQGEDHYKLDPDLKVILDTFAPGLPQEELSAFGKLVGEEVLEVAHHVDQDAPPRLQMHDLDGNRIDRALLSPAQKTLLEKLRPMIRPAYEGRGWPLHYAFGYLLADGGLYCILTITHQVAYALHKYAPEHEAVKRELLYGPAFGATWMTEIQGGSDLGANRTVARREGNAYRLYQGDKYFASGAGLADYAIVTARPEGAPAGPKGLGLFLLPREVEGRLNFTVRRFKEKLATRAVPSGEVELEGSLAYPIGKLEEGIYYTLENLTVSRLANAAAAMGIAKKAHLEALFRVRRRTAFGKILLQHDLIQHDLLEMRLRQVGGTALAFLAIQAFDQAWEERPPYTEGYHLARLLSHLAKGRTAEHASAITALAMELFGGLGFLEEYGVARWHREALITPIWEGPANIQALDMLEAILKKRAHEPLLDMLGESPRAQAEAHKILKKLQEEGPWYAKEALRALADAVTVYALEKVAAEPFPELAELYTRRFLKGETLPPSAQRPELYDPWSSLS
ncbi:acyl-CoA dehydrogenase family protein [Thermus antranikianii]|uniref:acyl-CoA dehydrogenase family protein n=1 Tax=Thermus antranikianii TaxID=88190 RepID=UPI001C751FB7|nr:acyl-CoA dehydrogenase family protein [Thermus antranikianii]QWK21564.1 MAG: acyl-CoA dehydrogenase family protein [Thermus antranikianii]